MSLRFPIGIGQWLVVRRRVEQAGWWSLVSVTGLVLGAIAISVLSGEGRELVALGAGGAIAGAVTGLGMAWLLRQPVLAL